MLWDAGQERIARESREATARLYVSVRDGYVAGNVAIGRARWSGATFVPPYVDAPAPSGRSVERQAMALARLSRMFPGQVTGGES